MFEQLKSGFKRTINWKKYHPKVSTERQNEYLNFFIYPSFCRVDFLFYHLKIRTIEKLLSSQCRNKKRQCYD